MENSKYPPEPERRRNRSGDENRIPADEAGSTLSNLGNQQFTDRVNGLAQRHLKAEKEKNKGIWFGMGMFGIVGWSVAVPTLLGTALGIWLDRRWPSQYSWTLMLLFGGLITGCFNAWFWIKKSSGEEED